MNLPLVDLARQYLSIKADVDAAIQHSIEQTAFIGGHRVSEFEQRFANYSQCQHGVACANGTDAIELALAALHIGSGDEVIVPGFTFFATAEAVFNVGATPILCDVDSERCTISAESIKPLITMNTKAVIVVHLYGQMADMDPIMSLCDEANITIIEDAAQAHGAEYKGRRAGSLGLMSTFSFYPGKNLGAYGDAGMVLTNDVDLATKVRKLANHGRMSKYAHDLIGRNSRMDAIQAAILSAKLNYLDQWTDARRRIASLYTSLLSSLEEIEVPVSFADGVSAYHLYVIRVDPAIRDSLMSYLKEKGISTGIHYPIAIPKLEAMTPTVKNPSEFPVSNRLAESVLSLPIFPELTEDEVTYVADHIKLFYAKEG